MARVFVWIYLILLISIDVLGQCSNPPTVTLSGASGNACGTTPFTLTGNRFGGSATLVTITMNGAGTISPTSATTSPFSFTYTPASGETGKKITITVTTNNPLGSTCTAAKATFSLTVNANPSAPVAGTITPPTCTAATGSVILNGLPSTGTWTVMRSPGGVTTSGTGTSVTISGLATGTYTFTVTNSIGCTSKASSGITIPSQPVSPAIPVQTIDCTLGTGKAIVNITSPTGTGLTYSLDAGTYQSGTSFSNVANGSHSVTVRNSSGCTTTGASFQVSCACINMPTVTLSSLAGSTCTTAPIIVSGNTFGGSATSVTITENGAGSVSPVSSTTKPFTFTYTPVAADIGKTVIITVTTNNPLGLPCAAATATYSLAVIAIPSVPLIGIISQPTCAIATGSAQLNGLPANATWTLTRTPGAVTTVGTGISTTISGLSAGTYTYTVSVSTCISSASDKVVINSQPATPSAPVLGTVTQPSCNVSTGSVVLNGLPSSGTWTVLMTPGGATTTGTGNSTTISGISPGTYSFIVTNNAGCSSVSSANLVISSQSSVPAAPVAGTLTQPTCNISTGTLILSGLPSAGTWTLIRSPGGVITNGSGTNYTVSNLIEGTYTYTVTNSAGCISPPSLNIVINAQPKIPSVPIIGTITSPTCVLSTGSVAMTGLPASGTWTLTRYPGTVSTIGTGTNTILSGLQAGLYNFAVTNSSGCVSIMSSEVNIPIQPETPSPPLIGSITQPHTSEQTGSVVLNGLPENGNWTLTLIPGAIAVFGSGTSRIITGLAVGTYNITTTNSDGCISGLSESFEIIPAAGSPTLIITNPAPVCAPATADITAPGITSGSSLSLTYTYWLDASGLRPYYTPTAASAGTYYIKGTSADGLSAIKPVTVIVSQVPLANAGPDQTLDNVFEAKMNAEIDLNDETGIWSLISGSGDIFDKTNAQTTISGLSSGKNLFSWTVTNRVCNAVSDTVVINVKDQVYQSLITPNMDGKNDYFMLKRSDNESNIDLIIFDRRGLQVYKNKNYDNSWNGTDSDGNPLPDDTYFYVFKTQNGTSTSGFIVIRH